MASKDRDDPSNNTAETDEETVALRKKRSRRVSFADREITSVHIFNRDEDYETPPNSSASKLPSSENVAAVEVENEVPGFFRELGDSDDFKELLSSPNGEEDDDDEVVRNKSFLRPIESPSPGSSFVGSATSNDEDNFFGPVSSSFIRPGRLSDSAASDEHHDITMDSTAFSMHFQSLVRSESGDLKTSTGVHLAFEEKTPSQGATPSDTGSFMVLTKAKKLFPRSPLPVDKVSGGKDDMSLVGENVREYDYGRLSPTLEALLAEGSKDLHAVSASDFANPNLLKSDASIFDKDGSSRMDQHYHEDRKMHSIDTHDMCAEGAPQAHIKLGEANGSLTTTLIDPITHDYEPNANSAPAADASVDLQIQTPDQRNKLQENEESRKTVVGMSIPNVDFSAFNGTPENINSKALQDLFTLHESRNQPSTGDWLKENSPKDRKQNSAINQITDQQYRSPLVGSISSLCTKRKQIFLGTSNSSRGLPDASQQPGSSLSKESVKRGESLSSIQQYKSKLKIVDSLASTLIDRIENSKLILSEYLSSSTPSNTVMEETGNGLQYKHVDAPIINLEEQIFSADLKKVPDESMINTGDGIGTPKNIGILSQDVDTISVAKHGESLDHMSACTLQDKSTHLVTALASPSQFTCSGKKVAEHLLVAENLAKGGAVISRSVSSSGEITFDHRNVKKAFGTPVRRLNQRPLSSTDHGDLQQHDPHSNLVSISSRQEGNSIEIVSSGNYSTTMTDKLDSLHVERRAQSSSPPNESNHLKDFTRVKRVDNRKSDTLDLQNVSENRRSFQTPSRDRDAFNFVSGSPGKNLQIATHLTWSNEEFPAEVIKASSSVSASPYVHRSTIEPSLRKSPSKEESTQSPNWKNPTQSPSRKELLNASHGDNMQLFVGKDVLSPNSNLNGYCNNDCHQGFHISQSQFSEQDVENSSRRKRKIKEIIPGDADHSDKINRALRSPKIHKSIDYGLELMSEHSPGSDKGNESIGGGTMLDWNDISRKFSAETNRLLSPVVDKLNMRMIGMLEDVLAHLKKVHKCEMLCSEIQSQKIYEQSSSVRQKRQAEIRSLLSKIANEKAKLQLMRVKREKLLKRTEVLSSGIQESELLRLNYTQHLSVPGERDAQVDYNFRSSCSVNSEEKNEVASAKVSKMKEEFEDLDRKIENLTKSFHKYCKMKGEPSCVDTIAFLNDNLKNRMCCRFIRQDMQLWEVDALESRNGHLDVVLNYHGFICQRLTVKSGPVSSLFISNKLNEAVIMKNFPNMDACTAFAFVFNAESTKKYVGSKSLAQETQTTSLLLRNLLDVVEEVQLARVEIRNLTQTSFNSPSAEQLNLQLSFIDFNSGRKVMITFDMTCLKCGIYPSEIIPCQLQTRTIGTERSLPRSLSAEIKAVFDNLRVGYSRIIRLCRGVSQVVQSSDR